MRVAKSLEERLFVAAVADVIADVIGIGEGQHDKIMAFAVAERARAGRLGFFVLGLAVNDGSGRFAGVFADPFPNTHHVAAGRIHDLAAAFLDLLLDRKLRAEGGDNHDILRLQIGDVGFLVPAHQVLDA
jgi:hypothetical protein